MITPLPFHVENEDTRIVIKADKWLVAEVNTTDHTDRVEAEANAAYIVLACNAFPQMKEALEAAHSLRTFRNVPKAKQGWTSYDDDVMSAIEAALAAAKGEGK